MSVDNPTIKEREPRGREIEVDLFRHGEAVSQAQDAELSELGREQAKKAIREKVKEIERTGGGAIKILESPVRRAKETGTTMQIELESMILSGEHPTIKLLNPRTRESLKAGGVIGVLSKRGIQNPVKHWLENPDSVEGVRPGKIASRIIGVIEHVQKLADRLPPGEKIYFICITHEVPQVALLHKLSDGNTVEELGGEIHNCEPIVVNLKGEGQNLAKVDFREQSFVLDLNREK